MLTTAGYTAQLPSVYAYLNDPANGANLLIILGGHILDLERNPISLHRTLRRRSSLRIRLAGKGRRGVRWPATAPRRIVRRPFAGAL